jgi:hypothetical protein
MLIYVMETNLKRFTEGKNSGTKSGTAADGFPADKCK